MPANPTPDPDPHTPYSAECSACCLLMLSVLLQRREPNAVPSVLLQRLDALA